MDVIFQSGQENRFTMQVDDYGTIYFERGALVTQDKELIKKLISHPLKKRGEYQLVSNKQRVVQYLNGEEPDKLTEDILDNITRQGIIELGQLLSSSEDQPTLIKLTLIGEPITDAVQEILDFYQIEKTKQEIKEEEQEDTTVETITNTISTDMTAKDAIEWIESNSLEDLDGFVTEEEERKTVISAWEDKLGDN